MLLSILRDSLNDGHSQILDRLHVIASRTGEGPRDDSCTSAGEGASTETVQASEVSTAVLYPPESPVSNAAAEGNDGEAAIAYYAAAAGQEGAPEAFLTWLQFSLALRALAARRF